MNLRKLTLWHTIDWYASSIGTEHEKRERAVLDQAIDAALGGTMSDDKLREAVETIVDVYTLDEQCTFCGLRDLPAGCTCPFGRLRAALADSATADVPLEPTEEKCLVPGRAYPPET